jgi:hypothetical protein
MMAPPLLAPDCAVAVTPPNRTEPRPKTALSGVFHRIAHEPEPSAPPVLPPILPGPPPAPEPPPQVESAPALGPLPVASEPPPAAPEPALPSPLLKVTHSRHLLGFAEPVANIPPIEDFLPLNADATGPETAERVEEPAPELAPPPEPPPAASPELAPIHARVRDLPPGFAAGGGPPDRPRNFVERLGRQLGEAVVAPTRDDPPRFEPLPERTTPASAAWRPPEPQPRPEPVVRRRAEPAPPEDRGERPSIRQNRRLYRRAKLSAEFEIAGVPCTLIDVSIGGFAATGVTQVEPNTLVPVTIRLMIDGIEVGTQLQARIVYVTQGRSSGRFVELSPSQMAFLRYIVTWRGESIGAVGMTTLLDAIAGGPERGFSGDRADDASKSRWWAGLIGRKITPPR